eukprot:26023-Pelagococcus_subviridis.AAC.5
MTSHHSTVALSSARRSTMTPSLPIRVLRTWSPTRKPRCVCAGAADAGADAAAAEDFFDVDVVVVAAAAAAAGSIFFGNSNVVTEGPLLPRTSASVRSSNTPCLKHACAVRGVFELSNHKISFDPTSKTHGATSAAVDVPSSPPPPPPPPSPPPPPISSPSSSSSPPLAPPAASPEAARRAPNARVNVAGNPPPTSASVAPSRSPHAHSNDATHRIASLCSAALALWSSMIALSERTTRGGGRSRVVAHSPCASVSASNAAAARPARWHDRACSHNACAPPRRVISRRASNPPTPGNERRAIASLRPPEPAPEPPRRT